MSEPTNPRDQAVLSPGDGFLRAFLPLTYLLTPIAAFFLGRLGWNSLGWIGIIPGIVLALPVASVAVGLLAAATLGWFYAFNRPYYDLLNGKTPPSPEDPRPTAEEIPLQP